MYFKPERWREQIKILRWFTRHAPIPLKGLRVFAFNTFFHRDAVIYEGWCSCEATKIRHFVSNERSEIELFFPEGGVSLEPKRACLPMLAYCALPR